MLDVRVHTFEGITTEKQACTEGQIVLDKENNHSEPVKG